MNEWQDMPAWLHPLVAGRPGAATVYRVWEDFWKPKLAELGITPDMLEPVGDPRRPKAVSVDPPGRPWRSGEFRWDNDGEFAVLEALSRLVTALET